MTGYVRMLDKLGTCRIAAENRVGSPVVHDGPFRPDQLGELLRAMYDARGVRFDVDEGGCLSNVVLCYGR